MKKSLRIIVQRPDKMHIGKFREIFRTSIEYNSNVDIPFNRLYDGLSVLFPYDDVILTFLVSQ